MFTADPTARVFNNKLYVYPSGDTVPPEGIDCPRFCMPGYHVFSLENGSTWKNHGWILKENEVPWGVRNEFAMWAPDCIEKDGKYYYFYPAKPSHDKAFRRIGVGVSSSPIGPFKWNKSYIEGISGIDPGLLLDDDNSVYLYYGGGQELHVVKLNDNMKKIQGKPITIQGLPYGYKEGSFPFKKNGIYYLAFAHVFPGEGYTIGYATSNSPLGPFVYRGKIMDNIANGTNHCSVVKYNGQWILFYHSWQISGYNKLRSICADYMTFNDDGSIRKVIPTLRGIGTPTIKDTIQVDRYNEIHDANTSFVSGSEPNGWMICDTKPNSYVRFDRVNFGDGEAKKMQARVSCGQRNGDFEIHIDSIKGQCVAKFSAEYTGGWNKFKTISTKIPTEIKGVHNIYVVFHNFSGSFSTVNLNWLIIN